MTHDKVLNEGSCEKIEYIEQMLIEFTKIMYQEDEKTLLYLLEVALLEAKDIQKNRKTLT